VPADRTKIARWTLACYWFLMFAATHWPDVARYKPHPDWPFVGFGAVVHVTLYGVWAVLWWRVLGYRSGGPPRLNDLENVWFLGLGYAMFDEVTQLLVGRTGKATDVLSDMTGITLVFVVLLLITWPSRRGVREGR
jgi:VanZ family protein